MTWFYFNTAKNVAITYLEIPLTNMTSVPDMVVVQARPPTILDELRGLISEGNGNKTLYNIIICFML